MSKERVRVSLRLQSGRYTGEIFRGIVVKDEAATLAAFVDSTLKELEVRVSASVVPGVASKVSSFDASRRIVRSRVLVVYIVRAFCVALFRTVNLHI